MKAHRNTLLAGLFLLALVAGLYTPQNAEAQGGTVIVSPENLAGWVLLPYPQPDSVPYQFVSGIAALGSGSLRIGPVSGNASNKFILYAPYINQAASDFRAFSYGYYVDPGSSATGPDTVHLYANVYVDLSSNGLGTYATFYDCRYDFIPPAIGSGVWGTASFTDTYSGWVNIVDPGGLGCPASLDALPAGSLIMSIALNAGDTAAHDNGLLAHFDAVTISTASESTTYDFEPAGATTGNDDVGLPFSYTDNRINFLDIAAPVAVYAWDWGVDADGQPRLGLILYGIDANSRGYEVLRITPEQIAAVPEKPEHNTLFAETTVNQMHIAVWRLSSGEFHVRVRKADGKTYFLLFEHLTKERQPYISFERD